MSFVIGKKKKKQQVAKNSREKQQGK